MILVDTSAWIEYLRDTGSVLSVALSKLPEEEIATCDAVRMELLAGVRDEAELSRVYALLSHANVISILPTDYDDAAEIYRQCRRQGQTVRKMIDCLVAAVAIRVGAPVLHMDRDYDILARHTPMQSYRLT